MRYRRSAADGASRSSGSRSPACSPLGAADRAGSSFGNPSAPASRWPARPGRTGVAILKYRLYDIDVVISKTIVYGSLAAFITAVYVVDRRRDRLPGVRFPAGRLTAEPGPVDPGDRAGGGGVPAGQGTGPAPGQPAGLRQAGHPVRGAQRVRRPDGRDLRRRGRAAPDGPGPGRGHRGQPGGGVAEGRGGAGRGGQAGRRQRAAAAGRAARRRSARDRRG